MRKIPTLFVRLFDEQHNKTITKDVSPGMEWVIAGEGDATEKIDGSCCAIIDGAFYRRYDAKRGKTPPPHAIPCCDPDPVTGHWPHWLPVTQDDKSARWHLCAYRNSTGELLPDGTYEAIGPHFQSNPYGLTEDVLKRHGEIAIADMERSFEGLRQYLEEHVIEGIVFWKDGIPQCKLKRSDFGFQWPVNPACRTTLSTR